MDNFNMVSDYIYFIKNDLNLSPFVTNVILLATAVLAALTVGAGILLVVQFYFKKRYPNSGFQIRNYFSLWFSLLMSGFFLMEVNSELIMRKANKQSIEHILFILTIVSAAAVSVKTLHVVKQILRKHFEYNNPDNLRQRTVTTQFQFIERFSLIAIWVAAGVAVLCSFEGGKTFATSLLASAGVFGIVITFAAQKSIANLMAGYQIAFTQPIRLDDVVIVEGQWGKVEKITLTYVVICLWDLRRLIVPINYFIEKPFENWTKTSSDLLPFVLIYADFTLPVDPLRKEFEKILKETKLWDGRVSVMQVVDVTEKTQVIRALMSASSAPIAFDLRCFVRERLLRFIQDNYPDALPKVRVSSGGEEDKNEQGTGKLQADPKSLLKTASVISI